MRLSSCSRIADVAPAQWDALFPAHYPFTRHRFLTALETHGCVSRRNGWEACHLLLHDDAGELAGAAPAYLKQHSWGEFVFDWSWAQASEQLGVPYYPKLVNAIPFVPSAGPRMGGDLATMAQGLRKAVAEIELSSAHSLFVEGDDATAQQQAGFLERNDVQFQWHNRGYADFAGFLATLSSDKRKKIQRERRRVAEAGIRFEHRAGDTLSEHEWQCVYALYANTYEERGQPPYLTPEFFLDYGRAAGTPFRLILGYQQDELVAVALTLIGGDTLYGRHWGAAEHFHSLHFECCYYQGIELCIREGLSRYDAGTQGEHKLARGFLPVITRSAHFIADARLRHAVADYLVREREINRARQQELMQHSPYRTDLNADG